MRPRFLTVIALLYAPLAILVLGTARDAYAQDARLRVRLDPHTAATVTALLDSARTLALPTEPLVQKALEGQSKGASGTEITEAVRTLIRDLVAARTALGDEVGADVLLIAAAVLDAGGAPSELERLRPHRSRETLAASLAGLAYLISRGVPTNQSAELIVAMLNARLPEGAFSSLQRMVERDLMSGAPAAESAAIRVNALINHGVPRGPGGGGRP